MILYFKQRDQGFICIIIFSISFLNNFTEIVGRKGARVNIFEQPARLNRGPGDISNLWIGFDRINILRGGEMRNALKPNSPNRWTRYINSQGQYVIPYIFGGKFDESEHSTIARAMMAIAQNTCIKFQKRAGETDYVEIKNERGEGCYTTVGRTSGKNIVMLETNTIATCLEFDIVVHELMHTIGLWHEQMRFDRDDYIKIHYENIPPAYYTQFDKIPETDSTIYGVKYDYESVMHYAKDAFASEPGKITMETVNKDFQDVIGKMKDASPNDYIKICNIYSCKKCMGQPFTPIHSKNYETIDNGILKNNNTDNTIDKNNKGTTVGKKKKKDPFFVKQLTAAVLPASFLLSETVHSATQRLKTTEAAFSSLFKSEALLPSFLSLLHSMLLNQEPYNSLKKTQSLLKNAPPIKISTLSPNEIPSILALLFKKKI